MTTGAFSPEYARGKTWKVDEGLWNAVLATIPRGSSVLDIGAGIGRYVSLLNQNGYKASGVDGIKDIEQISKGVVKHYDLTGGYAETVDAAEWGMFIEVGEHIPELYSQRVIENVAALAKNSVICSWATIGQRGQSHINCRTAEWVVWAFTKYTDFTFNEYSTVLARKVAGKGWDRKLLVFS